VPEQTDAPANGSFAGTEEGVAKDAGTLLKGSPGNGATLIGGERDRLTTKEAKICRGSQRRPEQRKAALRRVYSKKTAIPERSKPSRIFDGRGKKEKAPRIKGDCLWRITAVAVRQREACITNDGSRYKWNQESPEKKEGRWPTKKVR